MELQRSNNDHHLKRVRFNASSITVRDSQTGEKFEKTIDLIVVYISEFDIFKRGRVIYHVDSVIRETQEKVDEARAEILSGKCNVFDGKIETNTGDTIGKKGKTLDDGTITGGINWYYKNVKIVE